MPRVSQEHRDARRTQILDAARELFADRGFARTSMNDIVEASGLSIGAIYRYFKSKDDIVVGVCEQGRQALPKAMTAEALDAFFEDVRTRSLTTGHARLIAQIYAEASLSPALATVVVEQLASLREAVADLLPGHPGRDGIAEVFVALSSGYVQQLAVRGDVDFQPFSDAVLALVAAEPTARGPKRRSSSTG